MRSSGTGHSARARAKALRGPAALRADELHSAYMLIAIRYEERDLVQLFGPEYEQYRRQVGMLAPRMRRRIG